MGSGELAANRAHYVARIDAKEAQQDKAVEQEQPDERAADIEAQDELHQHESHAAQGALFEGIAQHDARMSGIETVVDFVPESDGDPSHRGRAQHQGDGGRRDFKVVGKLRKQLRQEEARLVGGLESQRDQDDVGKRKQGSRLAMVPLKHGAVGTLFLSLQPAG